MNLPLIITFLRIAAIPFVALFYYLPWEWAHPAAAIMFILAAISDWLDGYLARSMHQVTRLGAFLDPVADKVLVAVALVMIVAEHEWVYMPLFASVIIGREIVISALREWMAELGKRASVAVNWVGKFKTTAQLVSLIFLLWYTPGGSMIFLHIGSWLLIAASVLTLWSMWVYIKLAWPDLQNTTPIDSNNHQ
jgi:CDP-diacylglycerol---glycerol-3-phosphate 3-phosphatidyltransferase